ncbi:hypothetical protein BHYA_0149g00180 [Botrytis hyacinthi]|uniref:Nudix hydrolase domain-containing protein n=1 Tax=Botrytis hyacinthi TaxID=278943 RepID=A0A4Z1GG81_9HELO|nr:hypothetical protein BHYA_0149g00180 [Botrytis hyacinthi]
MTPSPSLKSSSTTPPIPLVGLGVFIIHPTHPLSTRENPMYLLGERINSTAANTWGLPGGHLEFGETFEEGASREVLEETGLYIPPKELSFFRCRNLIMKEEKRHFVSIFMVGVWDGKGEGPRVMEKQKCRGWEWYDDLSETDSIRLLILHPGTLGYLIHTTLRECRCDIHGNYPALSYVWGDANDTTYILVDGFRFAVTVNLAAALHDLRDDKRQLRLWADAICINQTKNVERSDEYFRLFKSPSKPYPNFLINIIIIELRGKASLDTFRGMRFARFYTGDVGVVPPATVQGDFTLTKLKDENSQNCCMFRPKEDLKNETYSKGIRAEINMNFDGFSTVQHCTYLGKGWVDCYSSGVFRTRYAGLFHDVRAIAVH